MQGRSKELDVLKKTEELWGDALKVSVKSTENPDSNYSHFSLKNINIKTSDIEDGRKFIANMEPVAELTGEEFKPDMLENGRIIDYQKNWKGRDYDTVAAPIVIAGKPYYIGTIVVRQELKGDQRYDLHEVLTEKRTDSPFKTGDLSLPGGDSYPSLINLLQKVKNIKNNKAQFSLKDPDIRYSLKENSSITYETLVKKPDMKISITSASLDDDQGRIKIYNNDIKKDIPFGYGENQNGEKILHNAARGFNPVLLLLLVYPICWRASIKCIPVCSQNS